MATKKITFDPDSGVPYGSNLTLYGGANFKASFTVVDTSNAAFDFSGAGTTWTASSQMQKSVGQLRDLGYMGTISNPYSAITQFGDLGNAGALHGFRNTIAALFNTKDLKLVDAGINDISQEFAEGNIRKTAKA